MNLGDVGQLGKDCFVTERNIANAVMSQCAHHGDVGRLLPSAQAGARDKESRKLAPIGATGPLRSRTVPEGFPLRRHVAVTRWYAKQEAVECLELLLHGDWQVGFRCTQFP